MRLKAATFATRFVPRWLTCVADANLGGMAESLDMQGRPEMDGPRTTLSQARCAFTLAHLYLETGDARLHDGAIHAWRFLDTQLRDGDGGYRASTMPNAAGRARRSYDQSFVLLALVTLSKAAPGVVPADRIPALWDFIESLTEHGTGALWEHDAMARAGAVPGDKRGQNPQMHMLEATLQAAEMTGDARWLTRAERYVALASAHLIDPTTGAVREWVGAGLKPLCGPKGARREPGHQFEWAWLLHRFADLGGDKGVRDLAERMVAFAETHGLGRTGAMAGAPVDALGAAGTVTEPTHLLWPATEAGKYYAWRHRAWRDKSAAEAANRLEEVVFSRFFASEDPPVWHNQLDAEARPIQPVALSRLVYHVALFVTEGARAGLWPLAEADTAETIMNREEFT